MKNKKANKWQYLKVLQGYIDGCGWTDYEAADEHDAQQRRELRQDLKSYRENDTSASAWRIVRRRIPAGQNFHA